MRFWTPDALRAFAPAMVGWWLAVAACLRLEQLHGDARAQALLPTLQGGVVVLLILTLRAIVVACVLLWRSRRGDAPAPC